MLLAIDPGVDSGWALFVAGKLVACGLGDPRASEKHKAADITHVVIEQPTVYPRSPVPPNDIVTLAVNAGEWGGTYRQLGANVEYVRPRVWKGSVPKDIHHARVWAALTPAEQGVVDAAVRKVTPSKRHNVLDAVGLGAWRVRQ